ncbi:LacI family DNA-binding transcriptional regulator [Intestinibacillus massiliensis]|uniref:LacI family DNA-binding transcriptional regulator n=1 Tax=Intestinibacillus massiliensis TaxID=1871029 RepID=UPI000B35EC1A|nr:LacI family DNA-binding transcriptional regulator [Intestinibacillus massiliensis]
MKITMKTIAERAGVSVNTVSQALRNMPTVKSETRETVLRIANELGYLETRTRHDSRNIALVSTVENLQDSYFYMSFQQRILQNIQAHGCSMTVYSSTHCERNPKVFWQTLSEAGVGGIVLLGDMDPRVPQTAAACGLPVVAIGTLYAHEGVCSVIEDNLTGAGLAVRHLYERGYRRIGYVGHTPHSIAFMERYLGYVGEMMRLGLPCPADWSITYTPVEYDSDALSAPLSEMGRIPEAFVCANDNTAIVLAKALSARGLTIPNDVALVGFDNSLFGKMSNPSLATVDVHCALQAETGIQMLMRAIETRELLPARRIALPCSLVEGDSVTVLPIEL